MNNSKFRAIDLSLGSIFVVLMMIGANIQFWFPLLKVSGVPITLQTFFAVLAGILLGKRLGTFSMIVYLAVGAVGVPAFAEMGSGAIHFIGPTGGFLISFIFVAFFSGWIVEKSKQPHIGTYLFAALTGLMINYIIGTPFMYFSLKYVVETPIPFEAAIISMVPYFIKDFIIVTALAVALPQIVARLSKAVPSLASRS